MNDDGLGGGAKEEAKDAGFGGGGEVIGFIATGATGSTPESISTGSCVGIGRPGAGVGMGGAGTPLAGGIAGGTDAPPVVG